MSSPDNSPMSPEMFDATEAAAKYLLSMSQLLNSIRLNKELTPQEITAIKKFATNCMRAFLTDAPLTPGVADML